MTLTNKEIKLLNRLIELRDSIVHTHPKAHNIAIRLKNEGLNMGATLIVKYLLKDYNISEDEVSNWMQIIKD